jgi:hypothetical protein
MQRRRRAAAALGEIGVAGLGREPATGAVGERQRQLGHDDPTPEARVRVGVHDDHDRAGGVRGRDHRRAARVAELAALPGDRRHDGAVDGCDRIIGGGRVVDDRFHKCGTMRRSRRCPQMAAARSGRRTCHPVGGGKLEVIRRQRATARRDLADDRIADRPFEQRRTARDPLAQHVGETRQTHDRARRNRLATRVVDAAVGVHLRNQVGSHP